jgi:hypothetical protein
MKTPWTLSELRAVHAEYLAGGRPSDLAKRRKLPSHALLSLFREQGWELRPKARYILPSRRLPDEFIAAMHADFMGGMTFAQVERKYGRCKNSIRAIFQNRRLPLRAARHYTLAKKPDGTFERLAPLTPEEIDAMVAAAQIIAVPPGLKLEWRRWPLARRAEFITRLRERLAGPLDRPSGPFSANVQPFDYGTPAAWEIVHRKNRGTDSRGARAKINIRSQGVIFRDELWFWNADGHGYYQAGSWTAKRGRPALHRMLWSEANGPIPPGHVVSHRDGNLNNLDPANLHLRSRDEVCRINQAGALTRKSRERTAILLQRSQKPSDHHELLKHLTPR